MFEDKDVASTGGATGSDRTAPTHQLMILLGSVREGGIGQSIGSWLQRAAEEDGRFQVDLVDLRELALPMMDEPNHPRLQQYQRPHTVEWSKRVAAAQSFLFAFPEYNYSYAAPIKNAVDYLALEWSRKPVGFVNWGGNSGGTRAQTAMRPVTGALGMINTLGSIEINFPQQQIENGTFHPNDQQQAVLKLILDELLTLTAAFTPAAAD